MDPTTVSLDWTSILSNQGPMVALLGLAVLYLKKELEKREKRLESLLERVTAMGEENNKVVALNTKALEGIQQLARAGSNAAEPFKVVTNPGG